MKTKRVAIPIFYSYQRGKGLCIENLDDLNMYLYEGWSIEHIDSLSAEGNDALVYILKYDYYGEE